MTTPSPQAVAEIVERLRGGREADMSETGLDITRFKVTSRALWSVVTGHTPWLDAEDARRLVKDFDLLIGEVERLQRLTSGGKHA